MPDDESMPDYDSRPERDLAMADWLEEHAVTLVACAGYMQLLTPSFLARFPGRILHFARALPAEISRSTSLPWCASHAARPERTVGTDRIKTIISNEIACFRPI